MITNSGKIPLMIGGKSEKKVNMKVCPKRLPWKYP
jgi:ribosomal protein L24E